LVLPNFIHFRLIFIAMKSMVFTIPGLYNSGPRHWQTRWEENHGLIRINQQDWETPACADWINAIDQAIAPHDPGNVILVAHSLGCCSVAHWSGRFSKRIKGALLVAPSDVEGPNYPPGTRGFIPMPLIALPFPTIVIASTDDPYVDLERSKYFARHWQSQWVNAGALGHINAASGLDDWERGFEYLKKLDDI
jgi:predicted alpha/beta hydrolase family esterase